MNIIPEGTLKYLLFNAAELERNAQRRNGSSPTVLVVEVDEAAKGGLAFHRGYGLLTEGPVVAEVAAGSKPLFEYPTGYFGRRAKVHAALMTTSKVALSEAPDEALALPTPAPAPKQTKPTKATKAAEEKSK